MVSGKSLTVLALALFIVPTLFSAPHASEGFSDCCKSHTKIHLHRVHVRNFTTESAAGICDMDSIIFTTQRGVRICANPQEKWVKMLIRYLRRNQKTRG
ncbi:C-C motif chemokine 20-like [Ambystoma mexicanum]|uniref:C-C motif chemokine 20-like n=1 Tax=Ambystoma mexicanum TaxID=8296 RepID=UPI0037E74DCF